MKCEKAGHSRVPSPLRAGQIGAFDDFAGDGVDLTEPVGRSTQAIAWIAALDMAVRPFLLIGFIADGMKRETRQLASDRSEEHTSELQSLMRISYAVFCLKKKNIYTTKLNNKYLDNLAGVQRLKLTLI